MWQWSGTAQRTLQMRRAAVFRAQLIRAAMKIPAEMLHTMNVGADRGLSEVAAPQLLNHELTWLGYREGLLPVTKASRQPSMSVHEHAKASAAAAASFKSPCHQFSGSNRQCR